MSRLFKMGVHYYIIGLVILSFGIALAVESMLGTSPFDALLVGLYRTFGLTIGSWEVVVGFVMIVGNALAERKRPEYFAFITSLITGIGIDSWLVVLRLFDITNSVFMQWFYLLFSLLFTALGISFYLQSNIAPNPMDRSMLIIAELTGWNLTYSRLAIGVLLIIIAFFFSGAIGIGTLLNAVFVGVIINLLLPFVSKLPKPYEKKDKSPVSKSS